VVLIAVAAITACGGDDTASETPTGSLTASGSPTATAPAGIAEFRAFAQQVSDALLGHDATFFTSRAQQVQMTCKGDETLGPCSGKAAGQVLTGITGGAWKSDATAIFTLDEYAANLRWYWSASLPAATDSYGSGELRLFALAWNRGKDPPIFRVITTSIVNTYPTGYPIAENQREAHVFNFERQGADWAFINEVAAPLSVTSSDWLSGQCSECYDYFELWQGATH
jgi:hypothetical protein